MKIIPNDSFFILVKEEIEQGKSVKFRVKGISMLPFLRNMQDEVILKKYSPDHLKPLDIVLFRVHNQCILHRIQRIDDDQLTIQGDGIYASQEHCTKNDVIGKVEYIVRNNKEIAVDNPTYTLLVRIWLRLKFMRKYLLIGLHVWHKIFSRKKEH